MTTFTSASNRIVVDPTRTEASPLSVVVGPGSPAGEFGVNVSNVGPVGVLARLVTSSDDTSWVRIRPEATGYFSLYVDSVPSLELYRQDNPRFINMHSTKSPDQMYGAVEIHRHA